MGTTAVMAVVQQRQLVLAAVGDSRAYLVRQQQPQQLTVDETLAQLLQDTGLFSDVPEAQMPARHVLWNCLGRQEFSLSQPRTLTLQPGDRLLLATDGVTDKVPAAAIAQAVSENDDPLDAAEQLVAHARRQGSRDDATCVAIYRNQGATLPPDARRA
jgi:protein phosphatase